MVVLATGSNGLGFPSTRCLGCLLCEIRPENEKRNLVLRLLVCPFPPSAEASEGRSEAPGFSVGEAAVWDHDIPSLPGPLAWMLGLVDGGLTKATLLWHAGAFRNCRVGDAWVLSGLNI